MLITNNITITTNTTWFIFDCDMFITKIIIKLKVFSKC